MNHRQIFAILSLLTVAILSTYFGCKDLGNAPPLPPYISRISPAADSVGREVKVEGERFGAARGTSTVRFGTIAALQYDEWEEGEIKVLVPAGATSGLLRVVVDGRESNGVFFTVLSSSFGVAQSSLTLMVGDSSEQSITGGTPPYLVVDQGDTTVSRAMVAGTVLTIRALGTGSTTIVIGDAASPQLLDTVVVAVQSLISFSSQIQPIFTNRCTNQGCHPGGGAPFPLLAGASYDNLVNVTATSGPCSGNFVRVKPFAADSSALVRRLDGTSCGAQMPLGFPQLSQLERDLIREWINQGAMRN